MKKSIHLDRQARFIAIGGGLVLFLTGNACSGERIKKSDLNTDKRGEIVHFDDAQPERDTSSQDIDDRMADDEEVISPESQVALDEDSQSQTLADQTADETISSLEHEVLDLYRRLHIELDGADRSSLIIELFEDSRLDLRRLGFELANLDLSSSSQLDSNVGQYAIKMLRDENPEIRVLAALLSLRMVPPDAMIAFTESLALEDDPIAAAPLLRGISRWPNSDAAEDVIRWFIRDDSPLVSATNATWELEQAGYLSVENQRVVIEHLRELDTSVLSESSMKLIALLGDASDLETLVDALLVDNKDQQRWAANALVETPRAVELVVQAAEKNKQLFLAASEALIRHRHTPEGLRRLASLPSPDEQVRRAAIMKMGSSLESDRLAEAVRLAGLDDELASMLLNRLLNGNVEVTPRVAKGILWYAEIELASARPNRALEASIALDDTALDPTDRQRADVMKGLALMLLGRLDDAYAVGNDVNIWFEALGYGPDQELARRLALYIQSKYADELNQEQQLILSELISDEADESEQASLTNPED